MAGYKRVLRDLEPVALYSFDGEQLKNDRRFLEREDIIDDIGNSNGGLRLETQDTLMPCYYMTSGLAPLDKYEQRAMRFCPQGPQPYAEQHGQSRWPKAYILAPNCLEWDFSRNEFTYVFLMRRESSKYDYDNNDEKYGHYHYRDVIFTHAGIVEFGVEHGWNRGERGWIKFPPINNDYLFFNKPTVNSKIGEKATMVTVRFKAGRLQVFANLEIIFDKTYDIDENIFSIDRGSKELTIGGRHVPTSEPEFRVSDRITAPTDIDQFTVYNKALTDVELARLYRRIWGYVDMIEADNPSAFFTFDDMSLRTDKKIEKRVGNYQDLIVMGERDKVIARKPGPWATTKAMSFTDVVLRNPWDTGFRANFVQLGQDFTMSFAFKIEHSERGVLFSHASEEPPYYGFTLWTHSSNRRYSQGWLELVFSQDLPPVTVSSNLTSGWHSIVIRRRGVFFDVWFDGERTVFEHRVEYPQEVRGTVKIGEYFFGSHLDIKPISGFLANFVVYQRALPEIKIKAFNAFESIYTIRGTATVNGNPAVLDIRVYSHTTGELITSEKSNPETGVWVCHLLTNEAIDIVALDHQDATIKVKSYGPILPSENNDEPYRL